MKGLKTETYIKALQQTWRSIGFDIIDISPNKEIAQEDLIDCVFDYIHMYGKLTKEELEIWNSLSYEEKETLAKKTFPAALYGL